MRRRCSIPSSACFWRRHGRRSKDAGHDPKSFGGPIGVFAGSSNNSYFLNYLLNRKDVTEIVGWLTTMMGNEKDYLGDARRLQTRPDGPALNIVTACSTSLVAVCSAVQSLATFQCDMALAGGVSVTLPQRRGYLSQDGAITSPDGHCRAFDQRAPARCSAMASASWCCADSSMPSRPSIPIYAVIKGAAEQRRHRQSQLHRAECRRPRPGDRDGPGAGEHRPRDHLLYRSPRHRHQSWRSSRDRRTDAGIPGWRRHPEPDLAPRCR